MSGRAWKPYEPVKGSNGQEAAMRPDEPCVVAIGVFDGLHVGHRELLRAAKADACERGVPCVALTFIPDPAEVVGSYGPAQRLLRPGDRVVALAQAGADAVEVLSFTRELSRLTPEQFVDDVVCTRMRPVSVHIGANFRFGRGGSGTPHSLRALGAARGFAVHEHGLVCREGVRVSATRIRMLLREPAGLEAANELLGRCHYVRGRVEHGRGEGTTFGFPTANVVTDPLDCMPAEGVYACYVVCGGRAWPAAANVGAPPTFSVGEPPRPAFLEANLVGFSGDLYGETVAVSFVAWLRGSRVFDSLEELEATVLSNIDWVRTHLGSGEIVL